VAARRNFLVTAIRGQMQVYLLHSRHRPRHRQTVPRRTGNSRPV